jgi:hypothetical protein
LSARRANIAFGVLPPEIAIRATPRASAAEAALEANNSAAAAATSSAVFQTLYVTKTDRGTRFS